MEAWKKLSTGEKISTVIIAIVYCLVFITALSAEIMVVGINNFDLAIIICLLSGGSAIVDLGLKVLKRCYCDDTRVKAIIAGAIIAMVICHITLWMLAVCTASSFTKLIVAIFATFGLLLCLSLGPVSDFASYIISKKEELCLETVLEYFETNEKRHERLLNGFFTCTEVNFLRENGAIGFRVGRKAEILEGKNYAKWISQENRFNSEEMIRKFDMMDGSAPASATNNT